MAKKTKCKRFRDGKWWADYYIDEEPQINVGVEDGTNRGSGFLPHDLDLLLDMRNQKKLGRLLDWWENARGA